MEEIQVQYQYFIQLNNGNLRIKNVTTTMQNKCDELRRETEENKQKLMNLKDEQLAEKAELNRKIEESNRNLESIKDGYEAEMNTLRNEIASTRHELNSARSQSRGNLILLYLIRIGL